MVQKEEQRTLHCMEHSGNVACISQCKKELDCLGESMRLERAIVHERIDGVEKDHNLKYDTIIQAEDSIKEKLNNKVGWNWFWVFVVSIFIPLFIVGATVWRDFASRETLTGLTETIIIHNQKIGMLEANMEKISAALVEISDDRRDLKSAVMHNKDILELIQKEILSKKKW